MKLYYVSLTFHYTKKKKKYEKFRGPEYAPGAPPLNPPLDIYTFLFFLIKF